MMWLLLKVVVLCSLSVRVPTRNGPLLRKLEKTKREEYPDLRQLREDRDAEEQRLKTHLKKEQAKAEAQAKKDAKAKAIEEANMRQYKGIADNEELKVCLSGLFPFTRCC